MASAEFHIKKAEALLTQLTTPEFHKTRAAQLQEIQAHAMLAQAIALTELRDKDQHCIFKDNRRRK